MYVCMYVRMASVTDACMCIRMCILTKAIFIGIVQREVGAGRWILVQFVECGCQLFYPCGIVFDRTSVNVSSVCVYVCVCVCVDDVVASCSTRAGLSLIALL
jgi:hypothetical protein